MFHAMGYNYKLPGQPSPKIKNRRIETKKPEQKICTKHISGSSTPEEFCKDCKINYIYNQCCNEWEKWLFHGLDEQEIADLLFKLYRNTERTSIVWKQTEAIHKRIQGD